MRSSKTHTDARLIHLFLDMLAAEQGAGENTLDAYRRDLTDFSEFLGRKGQNFAGAGTDVLRDYLADLDAFDRRSAHLIDGARRPLRVPVTDPQVEAGADEHGEYVRCAFDLPRGAFATVVLREVMKPQSGHVAGAEEEPE